MVENLSGEIWKDIKGYENHYQVSNKGRIKGLERQVPGKLGSTRTLPEKLLSLTDNGRGYLKVGLKKDGEKRVIFKVHRLVAIAFIPNPENKEQVNHIDGNKYNNSVENLEWTTNIENCRHREDSGLANKSLNFENIKKDICVTDENGNILRRYKNIESLSEAENLPDHKQIGRVANGYAKSYKGKYIKYDK